MRPKGQFPPFIRFWSLETLDKCHFLGFGQEMGVAGPRRRPGSMQRARERKVDM